MSAYHANGSVRGSCGHAHESIADAFRCAREDAADVADAYPSTFPTRAYSDRAVARLDGAPLYESELAELDDVIDLDRDSRGER